MLNMSSFLKYVLKNNYKGKKLGSSPIIFLTCAKDFEFDLLLQNILYMCIKFLLCIDPVDPSMNFKLLNNI